MTVVGYLINTAAPSNPAPSLILLDTVPHRLSSWPILQRSVARHGRGEARRDQWARQRGYPHVHHIDCKSMKECKKH